MHVHRFGKPASVPSQMSRLSDPYGPTSTATPAGSRTESPAIPIKLSPQERSVFFVVLLVYLGLLSSIVAGGYIAIGRLTAPLNLPSGNCLLQGSKLSVFATDCSPIQPEPRM